MRTHHYNSLETTDKIITNSDLPEYTLPNIVAKQNIQKNQLAQQQSKDDDVLVTLPLNFEREILELLKELGKGNDTPDTTLYTFFKKLYILFQEKPDYLELIFDKNSIKNRKNTISTLVRIRKIAKKHLTEIIIQGKSKNIFKTQLSTSILVDSLLSSFKMFMQDEQLFHKHILEMKTLKTRKE